MPNNLEIVTAPTWEPVSLEEAKSYIGQSDDADDALVLSLIRAARIDWERKNRQFSRATYRLRIDCLEPVILIPKPPLSSVTSIKYFDSSDLEQTVANSIYDVITFREPGEIRLKKNKSWPSDVRGEVGDVSIEFVCGHESPSEVPDDIRCGLLKTVSLEYDSQLDVSASSLVAERNAIERVKQTAGFPEVW